MSVEIMAVVLHHSRATGTDKLVLLGIANHAGDGGAWPTVATLARYANATDRTVQRSLEKLVALGELTIRPQAGGSRDLPKHRRPNRYDVHVACPITCDRSPQHRIRDLPQAPADLWTDPVTQASPGDSDVTPSPDVDVTPPGDAGVTQTVPMNHPLNSEVIHLPQVQDARADQQHDGRGCCSVCFLPAAMCDDRAATSGHTWTPRRAGGRR